MRRNVMIGLLGFVVMAGSSIVAQQPQQPQQPGQPKPKGRGPNRTNYTVGNVPREYQLALPTGLVQQMQSRLKLDENQKQTFTQLAKEYDDKVKQVRQEFVDKIQEMLTPEQRTTFDQIMKFDGWKRDRPKGVEMIKRNPWMFRILGRMYQFTDQQKEQVEQILEQYKAQLEAVGEDDQAKDQVSLATFNQIMTLLTPEQQEKVNNHGKRNLPGQR